jgi:hypothetical protein
MLRTKSTFRDCKTGESMVEQHSHKGEVRSTA